MLSYNSGENYTGVLTLNSESNLIEIDVNTTMELLKDFVLVKTAKRKGYIKRGKGVCLLSNYNGRYGTGYILFLPVTYSSRYVTVKYFVSRETLERRRAYGI